MAFLHISVTMIYATAGSFTWLYLDKFFSSLHLNFAHMMALHVSLSKILRVISMKVEANTSI